MARGNSRASSEALAAPKGFRKDALAFYGDMEPGDSDDKRAMRQVYAAAKYRMDAPVSVPNRSRAAGRLHDRALEILGMVKNVTQRSDQYLRDKLAELNIPGAEKGIVAGKTWAFPATFPSPTNFVRDKKYWETVKEPDTYVIPAGMSAENRERLKAALFEVQSGNKPENYVFNQDETALAWSRAEGPFDFENTAAQYANYVVKADQVAKSWKDQTY
jgi:hypothetical protein